MRFFHTDVLCIGAGLAGERVAIEAAKAGFNVICLSIVPPRRSHSCCAQGGMQAGRHRICDKSCTVAGRIRHNNVYRVFHTSTPVCYRFRSRIYVFSFSSFSFRSFFLSVIFLLSSLFRQVSHLCRFYRSQRSVSSMTSRR